MMMYKTGITVGVFDLFHVGHLNLLESCKAMCDYLIVAVCCDDYVTKIKHKQPLTQFACTLQTPTETVSINIIHYANGFCQIKFDWSFYLWKEIQKR